MNKTITLKNFSFAFPKKALFSDINLDLSLSGIHLLTGANGSGKTTLCRILLALQSGFSGKVLIDDLDVTTTTTEFIAEKIVYLKQSAALNLLAATPWLDLAVWTDKFSGTSHQDEIREALDYFDLLAFQDKPVWELSGGQRQRLALSALLLNNKKFWLLDEPAAGLDSTQQQKLKALLIQHAPHNGALIITHRFPLFADIADNIYEISNQSLILRNT